MTCDVDQDVEALIGFAFGGYAIYGPEEDGAVPSNLDECSGHVGETDDNHLSYDSPNLSTCRTGAAAVGTFTSPDNPNASLPTGEGGGGGERGGPPPGDDG